MQISRALNVTVCIEIGPIIVKDWKLMRAFRRKLSDFQFVPEMIRSADIQHCVLTRSIERATLSLYRVDVVRRLFEKVALS